MNLVRLAQDRREVGLSVITLGLFVAVAATFPQFASPASVAALLDDTSILLMLALGQALVLIARGVDLSIASNLALSGMAAALLNARHPELGVAATVALATGVGAMLGAVNGLLVAALRVPPIVATLGTLAIYRGLAFLISGGEWVNSNEMSPAFQSLVRVDVLGLTLLVWTAAALCLIAAVALRRTRFGRGLYAAGSDPAAARYVGVRVEGVQAGAFVLSGAIAGLCGYFWVARYGVAYADVALGFELQVIAACVIGGVSIAGGSGTVLGVLLGALFLGVIRNALPLAGISPFWQMAVSGAVIVAAVILNARADRAPRRRILEGPAQ
jgi:rhamnose transport system permease protein